MIAPRWLWLSALTALGCPAPEAPRTGTPPVPPPPPPTAPAAPSAAPEPELPAAFAERADERAAMVREIAGEGVSDPRVLAALKKVPRHAFVAPVLADFAYVGRALPIGSGQTISEPYLVAYMTQAVLPARTDKCLEIGTGSGYQAAVLSELCAKTYSIEYVPELADAAKATLRSLGYGPERLELRTGDGFGGWPEAAPFDAIVVTAAPEKIPQPLLDQLALGGRLVAPVGAEGEIQKLERWLRIQVGRGAQAFRIERSLDVQFVPFLGPKARENPARRMH